jgi:adenylate kinase
MSGVRLIMMGMPGVGKGTFAKLLSRDFSIPAISLGDEIRGILKKPKESLPEKYHPMSEIMKSGGLISDETAFDILKMRLENPDCDKGFILDGYPRTIP